MLDVILWYFCRGNSSVLVPYYSLHSDSLLLEIPSGAGTSGSDFVSFVLSAVEWLSPGWGDGLSALNDRAISV